MKENKEKELASGDEVIQIENVAPPETRSNVPRTLKLVPPSSSEKRKTMSKMIDTGNLPSRRGHKRQKVVMSTPAKTPVVKLNPPSTKAHVVVPTFEAPSLLRSEALAWTRFKEAVRHKDVLACYDMSIKEFEYSTVHNLFKVYFLVYSSL